MKPAPVVQINDKIMEFGMMITVTVTTGNNSGYIWNQLQLLPEAKIRACLNTGTRQYANELKMKIWENRQFLANVSWNIGYH